MMSTEKKQQELSDGRIGGQKKNKTINKKAEKRRKRSQSGGGGSSKKRKRSLTKEKEVRLRDKCATFAKRIENSEEETNVKNAWSELSELLSSWLNGSKSLEEVSRAFDSKSVPETSSSSLDSSKTDNGNAVQDNGIEHVIDAFKTAKQGSTLPFTLMTKKKNGSDNFHTECTLDENNGVFKSKEGEVILNDKIEWIMRTGKNGKRHVIEFPENEAEINSWLTKVLGDAWKTPQDLKKDLLDALGNKFKGGGEDYISDLVTVQGLNNMNHLSFEPVCDRSSCLCVTGESSAGKTYYVQHHVRQHATLGGDKTFEAALYLSLDKHTASRTFGSSLERSKTEKELHKIIEMIRAIIKGIPGFDTNDKQKEIDYELGNIQTHLFQSRTVGALELIGKLISDSFSKELTGYRGKNSTL